MKWRYLNNCHVTAMINFIEKYLGDREFRRTNDVKRSRNNEFHGSGSR